VTAQAPGRPPPRTFYDRDPLGVAPALLGKVLVTAAGAGRVVEVEAYRGEHDPASHAFRGRTPRNATMFGPPGHLYVYFTYGMHFCANVVCGPDGVAGAVLLRALAPFDGLSGSSGPALLCRSLGIDRSFDGADLVTGEGGVQLLDDGWVPAAVATSPRVGLSERVGFALDLPWRFFVDGDPHVSRRSGRARGAGKLARRRSRASGTPGGGA
jgi:DNA-3-methyladenine glycosylase